MLVATRCRAKQREEDKVKKEVQAHKKVVLDRQSALETIGSKSEDLVRTWQSFLCSCSFQDT